MNDHSYILVTNAITRRGTESTDVLDISNVSHEEVIHQHDVDWLHEDADFFSSGGEWEQSKRRDWKEGRRIVELRVLGEHLDHCDRFLGDFAVR